MNQLAQHFQIDVASQGDAVSIVVTRLKDGAVKKFVQHGQTDPVRVEQFMHNLTDGQCDSYFPRERSK